MKDFQKKRTLRNARVKVGKLRSHFVNEESLTKTAIEEILTSAYNKNQQIGVEDLADTMNFQSENKLVENDELARAE